ncbi:MAG: peptide ABC transporter substrate-binding protein [Eubacteriales bacterium]|nr:peptide ABC transporter substrate-binding protein [Eubacteriales bacterium]
MKKQLIALGLAAGITAGTFSGISAADEENIAVHLTAEISTMDTNLIATAENMMIAYQTNEGLYTYDENGTATLGMADSVDISEDGLTYTFIIRDAQWSDGTPVTANDFEYSWKRLADPDTGATYAFMVGTAGIKNAAAVTSGEAEVDTLGVEAVDDKTLVVELDKPVPYLPSLLIGPYFMPINQEFCEAQGDQYGLTKDNILSNGPFQLTDWEPGSLEVTVSKNPNYYGADNVLINSITYKTITDSQQAIMAWETGDLDEINITGDNVLLYKDNEAFSARETPMLWYIAANTAVEGLENANLRLALALAYDKDAIVNNILQNDSVPANFAVPTKFAKNADGVTFRETADATYLASDKEAAKEYFAKAVEELGKSEFTFELLYDDADDTKNIAQFIQSEIQTTLPGVTINLQVQPKKQRTELMNNKEFELGLTRWGADYQDATTFLNLWTSDSAYNYGSWSNADYDALMAQVNGEFAADNEARVNAMVEAESIVMSEAGILPVYQTTTTYLTNPKYVVPVNEKGQNIWKHAKLA